MAKEKVKEAQIKDAHEPIDISETLENLKKQADDFAKQEEIAKAMKNKAYGAIEALTAIQSNENKQYTHALAKSLKYNSKGE